MTLTTPPPPPVGVERCHGLFSSDYAVMKSFDHLTASVFLARWAYQTGCVTIFLHCPRRVTLLERSLLRRGATWYLRRSVCSCVSLWVFMQCPIGGRGQFFDFPYPADKVLHLFPLADWVWWSEEGPPKDGRIRGHKRN